jgi:hypothetical protein
MAADVSRQLAPHLARFNTAYLVGLPHDELLARASKLTRDTIMLLGPIFADGAGRQFIPIDAGEEIAAAAGAPAYVQVDSYLGRGAVGGYMSTFEKAGVAAHA